MDETEKQAETSEPMERDSITLNFELDPAHRRMDLALREAGVNVDEILSGEVTPAVEQKLYQLLQATKYDAQ